MHVCAHRHTHVWLHISLHPQTVDMLKQEGIIHFQLNRKESYTVSHQKVVEMVKMQGNEITKEL